MKRNVILSLGMALLLVHCSLVANPAPPSIPVTGSTLPPPTTASQPETPFAHSALFFDGQDDYIRVDDDPSLDLGNSFTVAAWIYLQNYTEWASLVTKGDKPNINNYAIQQSGPDDPVYRTQFGKLRFSGCAALAAPLPESRTILALRTWYFVATAYDGLHMNFYLNGTLDGSSNVTGPLCVNDSPLYIGVDFPLTTEYWHGAIDELRIWSSTLTESQIQDVMRGNQAGLESTLVGFWSFDEGSGSVAHDRSGHANDGELIGNPAWFGPIPPP